MVALKNKIKELASEQYALKNQRKTVKIQGERTMTATEARLKHAQNRWNLRHLHVVQAILKGMPIEMAELKPKKPFDRKLVDKLITLYRIQEDECQND